MSKIYQNFFLKRIDQYIPRYLYHPHFTPHSVSALHGRHCLDWAKTPWEWLSGSEALSLGIRKCQQQLERENPQFSELLSLIERVFEKNDLSDFTYLTYLTMGILSFEKALVSSSSDQKKWLTLSKYYFEEAKGDGELLEVCLFYQAFIEIGKGQFEEGISYLVRASRVSPRPAQIYAILAKVYHHLNMGKVARFYRQKSAQEESLAA